MKTYKAFASQTKVKVQFGKLFDDLSDAHTLTLSHTFTVTVLL